MQHPVPLHPVTPLAKVIMQGGIAALSVAAIIAVVYILTDTQARPDAFTGSDGAALERRLNIKIDKLASTVEAHMNIDAHNGAGRALAGIKATLHAIEDDLKRIEGKVEDK